MQGFWLQSHEDPRCHQPSCHQCWWEQTACPHPFGQGAAAGQHISLGLLWPPGSLMAKAQLPHLSLSRCPAQKAPSWRHCCPLLPAGLELEAVLFQSELFRAMSPPSPALQGLLRARAVGSWGSLLGGLSPPSAAPESRGPVPSLSRSESRAGSRGSLLSSWP